MSYTPPTITAQVAPGFSPLNPPDSGDWVDLPAVLSFSSSRGKQDTLGMFANGSATLVLDNGDYQFDQLITGSLIEGADGAPATPVRLKIVNGGNTYYRGPWYTVDGWTPLRSHMYATVTVRLTDWMGWAETAPMPESRYASYVTWQRPLVWIRGYANRSDLPTASDQVYNAAYRWTGAFKDMYPNAAGALTMNSVAGITPDDSAPALASLSGLSEVRLDGADLIAQSNGWTLMFWMRSTVPSTMTIQSATFSVITNASGYIEAAVDVGGTVDTATLAYDHCDDAPHLIIVNVTSTGGFRTVGVSSNLGTTFASITNSGASGGGRVAIALDEGTTVGDLAYWDALMVQESYPSGGWPGSVSDGAADLWIYDHADDRVGHLCELALVTPPTLEVSSTLVDDLPPLNPPNSLADGIRAAAGASFGDCWITRDGALRMRDVTFTSTDADDYDTVHALLTDDPAATGPPQVIYTGHQRLGTRADRIVNDLVVTNSGSLPTYIGSLYLLDLQSQLSYGKRPQAFDIEIGYLPDVYDRAAAYLAAHKDPPIEVGDVLLEPWGNQDLSDWCIETLELERRVTYREATPDNATELIDADYRIIGEDWSWSNGTAWTVTLRLEPV